MSAPNFLRVSDAAAKISLTRQRLWLYIRDGRCKSVKVGGVTMVSPAELQKFNKERLANGKKGGRPRNGTNRKVKK